MPYTAQVAARKNRLSQAVSLSGQLPSPEQVVHLFRKIKIAGGADKTKTTASCLVQAYEPLIQELFRANLAQNYLDAEKQADVLQEARIFLWRLIDQYATESKFDQEIPFEDFARKPLRNLITAENKKAKNSLKVDQEIHEDRCFNLGVADSQAYNPEEKLIACETFYLRLQALPLKEQAELFPADSQLLSNKELLRLASLFPNALPAQARRFVELCQIKREEEALKEMGEYSLRRLQDMVLSEMAKACSKNMPPDYYYAWEKPTLATSLAVMLATLNQREQKLYKLTFKGYISHKTAAKQLGGTLQAIQRERQSLETKLAQLWDIVETVGPAKANSAIKLTTLYLWRERVKNACKKALREDWERPLQIKDICMSGKINVTTYETTLQVRDPGIRKIILETLEKSLERRVHNALELLKDQANPGKPIPAPLLAHHVGVSLEYLRNKITESPSLVPQGFAIRDLAVTSAQGARERLQEELRAIKAGEKPEPKNKQDLSQQMHISRDTLRTWEKKFNGVREIIAQILEAYRAKIRQRTISPEEESILQRLKIYREKPRNGQSPLTTLRTPLSQQLGITRDTLRRWCRKYPKVEDLVQEIISVR